ENTGSGSANVVQNNGSAGSAVGVVATGSDTGSAGTMTGSDNGSATTMVGSGAGKPVDTVIASAAKGAMVEIEGTDMKGPAPFTAKLEKDRAYKARVTAPGFVAQEIEVKGGAPKVTAKLAAKSKIISVTTDPPGADILVDGVPTSKLTPSDVQLTAAQSARARVRITLRRPGYKQQDQYVETAAWNEGDSSMTASVTAKLVVAPKVVPNNNGNTTTNTGSGSGSAGTGDGSATTPTGGGTGSASGTTTTPPTGGTTTPPTGGTTTPPAGGTTTPPSGGTTPPSGGTTPPATGSASGGQTLK
ncbi:MAG TPA: hypothetical protein VMZ53_14045, partial [Kofleriaceae bacterium]|nr:hypothetical protein [Kofleriaceae bacterium]